MVTSFHMTPSLKYHVNSDRKAHKFVLFLSANRSCSSHPMINKSVCILQHTIYQPSLLFSHALHWITILLYKRPWTLKPHKFFVTFHNSTWPMTEYNFFHSDFDYLELIRDIFKSRVNKNCQNPINPISSLSLISDKSSTTLCDSEAESFAQSRLRSESELLTRLGWNKKEFNFVSNPCSPWVFIEELNLKV